MLLGHIWSIQNWKIRTLYANLAFWSIVFLLPVLPIIKRSLDYIGFLTPLWVILILCICVLHHTESIANKFLSSQPLVFLGNISYAVYLLHLPLWSLITIFFYNHQFFYDQVHYGGVALSVFVLYLVVLCLCSYLTYAYVERPMRVLITRKLSTTNRALQTQTGHGKASNAYALLPLPEAIAGKFQKFRDPSLITENIYDSHSLQEKRRVSLLL
jgi:peptidoglycan/LPS O-acetylase OafA/YrhL